ncbi:hypothetical protein DPEC_G00047030 [Dallia pectoralis]|uniref:Uncharacterized protein n=1 Tax=Dallia pectoralis TaxID=75939 RepID=A0ACC2HA27_DALPE|nr:hypothetical protein DPEC_G00047030 [Dallia pectoralis]
MSPTLMTSKPVHGPSPFSSVRYTGSATGNSRHLPELQRNLRNPPNRAVKPACKQSSSWAGVAWLGTNQHHNKECLRGERCSCSRAERA